jgi:hypothetical protein
LQEAWRAFRAGRWRSTGRILWQLFTEPTLAPTFVPRAGTVYSAVDREAKRIQWASMWRQARVRSIEPRPDGRYAVAYESLGAEGAVSARVVVARFVHVAVGYGGIRLLPAVRAYRERTFDVGRVLHAYEPHDHIYASLAEQGGTVLLRGRGITAARLLQRIEAAARGRDDVKVVHLLRRPRYHGARWRRATRAVDDHWDLQAFNWPKSAWGGDHRTALAGLPAAARQAALASLGGTTSPPQPGFVAALEQAQRRGAYGVRFGELTSIERAAGKLRVSIDGPSEGETARLDVDFVIDATGLEAGLEPHPLLARLARDHALPVNRSGGVEVDPATFEITALANARGTVFAAGMCVAGGAFAPVDSFLGMQVAALASIDRMIELGAPHLKGLNPLRSLVGWLRWAEGTYP